MTKFIYLYVYRAAGHHSSPMCITSRIEKIYIIEPTGPWTMDSVRQDARRMSVSPEQLIFAERETGGIKNLFPIVDGRWAASGNLANTSDSRWKHGPIALHDMPFLSKPGDTPKPHTPWTESDFVKAGIVG